MKETLSGKKWRECLFSDEFLKASKALVLQKGETALESLNTNSKTLKRGQIFIALEGARFNGHDFLQEALQKSAGALVVSNSQKLKAVLKRGFEPPGGSREKPDPKPHKKARPSVILVPDTLQALQSLASLYSQKMKTKVAALTGSCGKTTARAFAQTLFGRRAPFAGPKSYNNAVGVPLCLAGPKTEGTFLIQEIGTNRPGEISALTALCHPVVAAVNMVGPSHLQGLGRVALVAKEKQDIYLKSPKALWVFNKDNPWTKAMFCKWGHSHKPVLSFSSKEKSADVHLVFAKESFEASLVKGHIGECPHRLKQPFPAGTIWKI